MFSVHCNLMFVEMKEIDRGGVGRRDERRRRRRESREEEDEERE